MSEDTIHPILRKSPTVAAVLSLTFGCPFSGLDKSSKPRFLSVVPCTLSPYVSKPDVTFPNCVGSVVFLFGSASVFLAFGFTNLDVNGVSVILTSGIGCPFSPTGTPFSLIFVAGLPLESNG